MKTTKIFWHYAFALIAAALLIFSSCKKEEEKNVPVLNTTEVTDISQTTATSGGNITYDSGATVTARGVCWSTSQNPTINDSKTEDGTGTGSFESSISGLEPNTTYFVRAYATNSAGTSYGNEISFTTGIALPTVVTVQISNITSNSALSGGVVTYDGGGTIIARGMVWDIQPNPVIGEAESSLDGQGMGDFTTVLTSLSAGTEYYARSYATNEAGTSYGNEYCFTTNKYPQLFNKIYPGLSGYDMSQTDDYGFIIAGNICFNSNGYGSNLIKTDSLGNVEWTSSLEDHVNPAVMGRVMQTIDGGYVLSNQVSIQRFDRYGNNLWVSYKPHYFFEYNSVAESNDGGFMVAGVESVSENLGTIIKLDANGNKVWQKYYDRNSISYCTYIMRSLDDNFMVIGGAGQPYATTFAVSKIDGNGNILWTKEYGENLNFVVTAKATIQQVDNNSFIINCNPADYQNVYSGRVLKISQDGNVLWDKHFNVQGGSTQISSIVSLPDGGYAVAGFVNFVSSNSYALVMKLDSFGNEQWKKLIYPDIMDFVWGFKSVISTRSNTLTFMGYKGYVWSGTESGLWLMRTDSDGNEP